MEFNEKLVQLRKSRNMTQDELAEALYVSRAAVSKWESGRGMPSIDSIKDISRFFSVSIDELLSGEKLLFLAETENSSNTRKICDIIFGFADLLSFVLFVLPLYPSTVDGYVYSVSLLSYTETSKINIAVYWLLFALLVLSGVVKLIFAKLKTEKSTKLISHISLVISVVAVLFLALTREVYALIVAFLLFVIKMTVLINRSKLSNHR
jgi:transcriptional regulator with XRE-family HTH domain